MKKFYSRFFAPVFPNWEFAKLTSTWKISINEILNEKILFNFIFTYKITLYLCVSFSGILYIVQRKVYELNINPFNPFKFPQLNLSFFFFKNKY